MPVVDGTVRSSSASSRGRTRRPAGRDSRAFRGARRRKERKANGFMTASPATGVIRRSDDGPPGRDDGAPLLRLRPCPVCLYAEPPPGVTAVLCFPPRAPFTIRAGPAAPLEQENVLVSTDRISEYLAHFSQSRAQ